MVEVYGGGTALVYVEKNAFSDNLHSCMSMPKHLDGQCQLTRYTAYIVST